MKKSFNKILILGLAFSIGISSNTFSQENQIPLWDTVPGAKHNKDYKEEPRLDKNGNRTGIKKVTNPSITPYLVNNSSSNNTAVIICPGGAYSVLAIDKEGIDIAKYFNSIGVSAFVLKYRLPTDLIMDNKTIGPLQDAQEAIRTVRRNAKIWNINPNKIGIMGFSAGGHLASTLSTHYNDKVYQSDETNAKPNFSILIYPVISMEDGITHKGSRTNLLGKNASIDLIKKYSNEKQIDANTPPTFLVHATDDLVVPVENSINYYLKLKEYKVRAEMHLYENGGHGFGLGKKGTNVNWTHTLKNWLDINHLLP
ncbi:1,4-beta-xylanase [Wenyingzhuangia fucanilytica]|uniref:1,4-beta-xylanase n=1 Tax=Wenyingzhuangia fucanilytica TaxID=1790137 RepID=A0A1B1Y735_9FLAO|nr:alpha/beta hydrolase [Wenyingzhuangia fucanilytica]ANW96558.1 1,4-beta-xylanase [Wenyingzhuangia fucanilytica]